jgi:hypothetical protein
MSSQPLAIYARSHPAVAILETIAEGMENLHG